MINLSFDLELFLANAPSASATSIIFWTLVSNKRNELVIWCNLLLVVVSASSFCCLASFFCFGVDACCLCWSVLVILFVWTCPSLVWLYYLLAVRLGWSLLLFLAIFCFLSVLVCAFGFSREVGFGWCSCRCPRTSSETSSVQDETVSQPIIALSVYPQPITFQEAYRISVKTDISAPP